MLVNLKRIWEITQIIYNIQEELGEKDIYLSYNTCDSFEYFMEFYSFKLDLENKQLCYYNNDPIPYEDYNYNEFNYLPLDILDYTDLQIIEWVYEKGNEYLETQKQNKLQEISKLKHNISFWLERLKKLENNEL